MVNEESNGSTSAQPAPAADANTVSTAILHSILNDRQKRKLGLLPKREPTEKEKERLEALRERMRAMNNARREKKLQSIPTVKVVSQPKPAKKRKQPESSDESESESVSEDPYVQKKARKVNQTLKQLTKVEQHMAQLRQVQAQNPFYHLLRR